MLKIFNKNLVVTGLDEAGRGPLAGPVIAGAAILPADFFHPLLNDSKQLSEKQRDLLRPIIEKEAIEWSVASVSPEEIDEINILNASFLAMHRCVDQLKTKIDLLLIDGNRFNLYPGLKHKCMIKGDARFYSIAAASILAKTHRDDIMRVLHNEYPIYQWDKNKGYPTKKHREAIARFGTSPYHRKTFQQLPRQLKLKVK
jgi:ribonuclease HII